MSFVYIVDDHDYRVNLSLMRMLSEVDPSGVDDPVKFSTALANLKRGLREYVNRDQDYGRRIVKDNGINGYIELVRLPDDFASVDEAESFFERFMTYRPTPCAYDCTGRAFTAWYKVFKRSGGFWCYHCVGMDV